MNYESAKTLTVLAFLNLEGLGKLGARIFWRNELIQFGLSGYP
jgi:hypothetical protein